MDYFSKEEADVIGEISNISIGSSATAMNKRPWYQRLIQFVLKIISPML